MSNKIDLSIVILCYRTGQSITGFANSVKSLIEKLSISYEIILVANYHEGSKDNTRQFVSKLAIEDSHFKVISKIKKGMMGWDMRQGLDASSGEYICVIDGDGQFAVDSIVKCYNEILKNDLDFVKTYRDSRHDGFYRKFVSNIFNAFFNILFPGLNSKDINSKPKLIKREIFSKMNLISDDWFVDAEIMINVRRQKAKFSEIPITFIEHTTRKSFVKFSANIEFVKNLLVFRFKEFFV